MGVFWQFLPYIARMREQGCSIFSGILADLNIFRSTTFRAFSVAWFTQSNFLTELNSPISFATIFLHLFFSSNLAHIANLSLPLDSIYNGENRLSLSSFILRILDANIGVFLRKSSYFGTRRRKYANTSGGGGHVLGQKLFQIHFYYIFFVFV